jgi:hypothetical protein
MGKCEREKLFEYNWTYEDSMLDYIKYKFKKNIDRFDIKYIDDNNFTIIGYKENEENEFNIKNSLLETFYRKRRVDFINEINE